MRRSIHPRPSSKRAICATVIPLLLAGCRQHEQQGRQVATAPAPQRSASDQGEPAPAPLSIDPYDTPYAVVPAQSAHDTCLLPANARTGAKPQWAPVWTLSSRLDGFSESRHELTALRAPRPGVGGFCAYKWTDPHSLPRRQDFQAIGAVPDRPLLTASTAPVSGIPQLPETVSGPLLKLFDKLAGGAPRTTTKQVLADHAAKAKGKAMPVKVAVIDATPTKKGLTSPDRTFHGFSVSRTVARLACEDADSPACAEQVVAQLALPIVGATEGDATEDFENGGRTGSFTHLYDAIERALDAWKPKEQHLVINFSVGWDPVKADPGDENVERIKAQLERASCLGALIVAAAGNYSGSTGPVFPAAFEALKAPTGEACAKFKLDGIAPAAKAARASKANGKTPPYAPLVHSVGAVDALDQRLLVNRRWGQPRLAALGVSVMVPGPPGTPYTPPHDGTSMASAIVSGIAAAVWAARPELDAASVMQAVYDGGVKLDPGQPSHHAQTEYCEGEAYGPCHQWPVHRANLCGALAKALPGEKLACDTSAPGAAELPSWPAEAKAPAGKPKQPCRLTECGVPQGPMANQLAAGAVGQGSYGNCNSCTFQVLNTGGTMTLAGTPTVDPPNLNMDWYTATLNTDQNQSYPLSITFGTSMTGTQLTSVLANTSQASITWVIKIHNVAHTVTNISTLTRVPPY